MRVLHHTGRLHRLDGGVTTAIIGMADALASAGTEIAVLTRSIDASPVGWGSPGKPTFALPVADLLPGGKAILSRAAQAELIRRYDLIHLHGPWNLRHHAVAAACQESNIPYVVTLHGMIDGWSMNNGWAKKWKKRIYLAWRARKMLHQAAFVHSTALIEAEQAKRFLPRANFRVLPCIFNPGELLSIKREPRQRESDRPFRVLFLSRLHPKKRPDLLIALAAEDPRLLVTLAGPGDKAYVNSLISKAKAFGVEKRVFFTGMVSGEEKRLAYANADCFVLPTSQENFGLVLPEAIASGLPTVTTRGTAIWRELKEAGAWIVEQNVAAIAAAVREIYTEPSAAAERASNGRTWINEHFTAEALRPGYLQMYNEAITGACADPL